MKKTIRAIALLLSLALAFALSACSEQQTTVEPTAAPAAEINPDSVAVEVGDGFSVTYAEVEDYYNYLISMMSYYGMSAPTADADIESYQDQAVAALLSAKKQLYFAEQMGLDELTAEESSEVQALVDEEMDYYLQEFTAMAEQEGAADVAARAEEIFAEQLAAAGMDMDVAAYEEYVYSAYAQEKVIEKLEAHIRGTAAVTEDDVKSFYESLVTSQTASYEADAATYLTDAENYEMNGGTPAVVVPEGYIRVKVIAVEPQTALDASYEEKTATMANYEAEYGKLALSSDANDAARMKEIETLYKALEIETDKMYEEYIAPARTKIEEAKAKLDGGEAFDAVLASHGEDTMYIAYRTIAERGRLMMLEGDDGWETELREAALALNDGEYSDIIRIDDAYYIVCRVGSETAGTVALEDIYEAVEAAALLDASDTVWNEQLNLWDADDSMVTYHEEVYRSIGKNN